MKDCQKLQFSAAAGTARREKAERLLGKAVVTKMIGLALFWLGAKRPRIAEALEMSENSLRTTIRVVSKDGLAALQDRRRSRADGRLLAVTPAALVQSVVMDRRDDVVAVRFGNMEPTLRIPASNPQQSRVVLLSLVNSGLVSTADAARVLELTPTHVRNLAGRLADGDVQGVLDRRRGQQRQYVLTSEAKSEIVLQYAANAAVGASTNSRAVAADIKERCGLVIADRTLRHCAAKLGLGKLKALPELAGRVKKGSAA